MFFYPVSIVPSPNFSNIDIDKLNRLSGIIVVRRSEAPKGFDTFTNGRINQYAILGTRGFKALPRLSLNLLGGKFKTKHIKYIQRGKAGKEWYLGESIKVIDYISDVDRLKSSIPIYIKLYELHKVKIPYIQKNEGELKKKTIALKSAFSNLKRVELKAEVIIRHKPNKLNYWHIEMHIKDDDELKSGKEISIAHGSTTIGTDITDQSGGVQIGQHIWETKLINNCMQSLINQPKRIDKKYYTKGKHSSKR